MLEWGQTTLMEEFMSTELRIEQLTATLLIRSFLGGQLHLRQKGTDGQYNTIRIVGGLRDFGIVNNTIVMKGMWAADGTNNTPQSIWGRVQYTSPNSPLILVRLNADEDVEIVHFEMSEDKKLLMVHIQGPEFVATLYHASHPSCRNPDSLMQPR
jgi:hypothetical protein